MEAVIVLLVVAAVVGGVIWNHRNKSAAFEGVEFRISEPPAAVAAAVAALYCRGAKAVVKSAFSRISVTPVGAGGFTFGTKRGDEGQIEIHPNGSGSIVRASTSELYIGSTHNPREASGIKALSYAITHLIFLMLRLAPYAANMKRFQRGLEHKLQKQVSRQISR
ncbi:hypothetical protein [Actinophytocola gossypii]|uniref:Uncharacterized protein n=1 Tax=Actinophytocola gossypii TaxID=2812003 RepID=A0ABT2JK71_9PSEU|nr:hypothetical protein [Actinophytocola gossypii]MCT2588275.1 hypothetical protein [Actinophytocola gossypii]